MEMSFDGLVEITKKDNYTEMGILQFIEFLFLSFISQ